MIKLDTRTARTLLIYVVTRIAGLITAKMGVEAIDPQIIQTLADGILLPLALYYLREGIKKVKSTQ